MTLITSLTLKTLTTSLTTSLPTFLKTYSFNMENINKKYKEIINNYYTKLFIRIVLYLFNIYLVIETKLTKVLELLILNFLFYIKLFWNKIRNLEKIKNKNKMYKINKYRVESINKRHVNKYKKVIRDLKITLRSRMEKKKKEEDLNKKNVNKLNESNRKLRKNLNICHDDIRKYLKQIKNLKEQLRNKDNYRDNYRNNYKNNYKNNYQNNYKNERFNENRNDRFKERFENKRFNASYKKSDRINFNEVKQEIKDTRIRWSG